VREFVKRGFGIISTSGTSTNAGESKIKVKKVFKLHEGDPRARSNPKTAISASLSTRERQNPARTRSDDSHAALAQKIRSYDGARGGERERNSLVQKSKLQVRSLQNITRVEKFATAIDPLEEK